MKQCLIIEDSAIIRKVGRLILEQIGYKVSEAESADEALVMCQQEMPQLILLDWMMPGMTAHDFLQTFSQTFPRSRTQIIYCVTELDSDDINFAFSGGITDFIMKPYNRESLQEKIMNLARVAA